MKIVDLKTFLALPPQTLFAKYEPVACQGLAIKTSNCGEMDFFVTELDLPIDCSGSDGLLDLCRAAEQTDKSLPLDLEIEGRDGFYAPNQLFAVWEPQDVRALIERLQRCLPQEGAEPGRKVDLFGDGSLQIHDPEKEPILYVDATPDEEYPKRILQAYLDSTRSRLVSNPPEIGELMNRAQEERAAVLSKALAKL